MPDLFGNDDDRDSQPDYRRGPARIKDLDAPKPPTPDPLPAFLTREAIDACTMCDPDGYRNLNVCDHIDHSEAARRGAALVREALRKGRTA